MSLRKPVKTIALTFDNLIRVDMCSIWKQKYIFLFESQKINKQNKKVRWLAIKSLQMHNV